jgi:enediyne biosynthesis protein E4
MVYHSLNMQEHQPISVQMAPRSSLFVTAFAIIALSVGATAALTSGESGPIQFEDVTSQAGLSGYRNLFGSPEKRYIVESTGNGAAWIDYDNDGCLDLFVVNGSTLERQAKGERGPGNRLYHNKCDGTFEDATTGSGLEGGYWGSGVATGDYDNDGFVDLFVTSILEGNHLYHNNGDGTFTDVTAKAGVSGGRRVSVSAAFFDYDRDGRLDLFVTNYVKFDRPYLDQVSPYCLWKGVRVFCGPNGVAGDSNILYHNNGDGTFTDVTKAAGLENSELKSLGVVVADLDDDGWPDIYVAADSTMNALYHNNRNGTFADISLQSGAGFSQDGRAQSGMGVDAGDYDGDGRLDLFVTNFQDDYNTLYHNEGGLSFTDASFSAKIGRLSFNRLGWGTGFQDFDNDGRVDIFVANGHVYPQVDSAHLAQETYAQQNQVLRNQGAGSFSDVTGTIGGMQMMKSSRGVAFGDFDNDGRMDAVVVNMDDTLTLLRNTSRNTNHWLTVRTIGRRSNRDGIGARLRLRAGGHVQVREVKTCGSFASANDSRVHFGLGPTPGIERLEISWPSGIKQTFLNVPIDQFVVIDEEKGLRVGK